MNEPRAYRDEQDLQAMLDVLVQGRKSDNGSYYVHSGDLRWWLYYPPLEGNLWKHIHLWDDSRQAGRVLGWALISPDWVAMDVYTQPELLGSDIARKMYLWAEEQATRIAVNKGKKTIYVYWIRQDDIVLNKHFNLRGFHMKKGMIHFSRSLNDVEPSYRLADGFILRECMGEQEVTARARAQFETFNSKAQFNHYLERFTNFMRSPVYKPELDIVAVAPDGQIGAFCIVWIDPVNRVGLFEPVGTHPDFQRKGLGRSVMLEGMKRLQERGMKSVIVSTNDDNMAGIKFYEALGFRSICKLGTFEKDV